MPSCVALGCQRRKDLSLKVFPRKDRRRRQIWIERVNRLGWTSTKYSALCELHFDKDQWELPREDGKRKLKVTALPTIFKVMNTDNCGIEKEHAYCLPFYRKIYNDGDIKTVNQENVEEETLPIELIKMEVDRDNFAPETIEAEEEDKSQDDVENIQCTPDIFVVCSEQEEPYPIEMVECENDDINELLPEPNDDPLAISAEDQVHAETVQPYFGKSQKFLFVPKPTKFVVKRVPEAKGDPQANKAKSKDTNSGEEKSSSIAQPKLKVKSLEGLLDPTVALKTSSTNNARVSSEGILRSPSAVYVQEKLTWSAKGNTSVLQLKSASKTDTGNTSAPDLKPAYNQKLEISKDTVTLTSPKFSIMPQLKVIPANDALKNKLNLVSTEINKDVNFIRKLPNLKIEKPAVLPITPRPNILIHNLENSQSQQPKVRPIMPKLVKIDGKITLDQFKFNPIRPKLAKSDEENTLDQNVRSILKTSCNNDQGGIGKNSEQNKYVESTERSKKLIKLDLTNHEHKELKTKKFVLNKLPSVKNSSVVVLNPFKASKPVIVKPVGYSEINSSNTTTVLQRKKTIIIYKCDECKVSFTSPYALMVHKGVTGHRKKQLLGKVGHDQGQKLFVNSEGLKIHNLKIGHGNKELHNEDGVIRKDYGDNIILSEIGSRNKYISGEDGDSSDGSVDDDEMLCETGYGNKDIPDEVGDRREDSVNDDVMLSEIGSENKDIPNEDGDKREHNVDNDIVILDTSSESSNEYTDWETLEEDEQLGEGGLSEDSSRTVSVEENTDSLHDTENGSPEEREAEVRFPKKLVIVSEDKLNSLPKAIKQKCVKLSDLNSLSNSNKDRGFDLISSERFQSMIHHKKSLRLIQVGSSLGRTDKPKDKTEGETISNELEKFVNIENQSKRDASSLSSKAKFFKKTVAIDKDIEVVYERPKDFIPKIDLTKINSDGDPVSSSSGCREKELVKINEQRVDEVSSESESDTLQNITLVSSARGPKGGHNQKALILISDDSFDETESIDGDESINIQKKPVVSLPKIDVNREFKILKKIRRIVKNNSSKESRENKRNSISKRTCKEKNNVSNTIPSKKLHRKGRPNEGKINESEIVISDDEVLLPKERERISHRRTRSKRNELEIVISDDEVSSHKMREKIPHSRTLRTLKGTLPSNNRISESLPQKINLLEGETKNKKVRSNRKWNTEIVPQVEEDVGRNCDNNKINKISETTIHKNRSSIAQKSLKNLHSGRKRIRYKNNELTVNRYLKSKKGCPEVRSVKLREEKNNSSYRSRTSQIEICKLCGERVLKFELAGHLSQHASPKTSVCQVCKKKFNHAVLLRRHMKTDHFV